jgi:protein-S-isoprenylcysteine O-methyltransferase Ste14
MNRWKEIRAIVLLPGMVTTIIPWAFVNWFGLNGFGQELPPSLDVLLSLLGIVVGGLGLLLVFKTVVMFSTRGKGTLAPWDPPQKLVVEGVYRHVRNPMISGVCGILLGEGLLLKSLTLLAWFAVFWAINAVYIPLSEEPGLSQRFGDDYITYKRNVPRWIPRIRPWEGEAEAG